MRSIFSAKRFRCRDIFLRMVFTNLRIPFGLRFSESCLGFAFLNPVWDLLFHIPFAIRFSESCLAFAFLYLVWDLLFQENLLHHCPVVTANVDILHIRLRLHSSTRLLCREGVRRLSKVLDRLDGSTHVGEKKPCWLADCRS